MGEAGRQQVPLWPGHCRLRAPQAPRPARSPASRPVRRRRPEEGEGKEETEAGSRGREGAWRESGSRSARGGAGGGETGREGSPRVWAAAEAPRGPRGGARGGQGSPPWGAPAGGRESALSHVPGGGRQVGQGRSVGRRPPGTSGLSLRSEEKAPLVCARGTRGPDPPAPRGAAAGRGARVRGPRGLRGRGVQGVVGSTRPGPRETGSAWVPPRGAGAGGPLTCGSCLCGRRDDSASGSVGTTELTDPKAAAPGAGVPARPRPPPPGGKP